MNPLPLSELALVRNPVQVGVLRRRWQDDERERTMTTEIYRLTVSAHGASVPMSAT
jgi:hypothetical protein